MLSKLAGDIQFYGCVITQSIVAADGGINTSRPKIPCEDVGQTSY